MATLCVSSQMQELSQVKRFLIKNTSNVINHTVSSRNITGQPLGAINKGRIFSNNKPSSRSCWDSEGAGREEAESEWGIKKLS